MMNSTTKVRKYIHLQLGFAEFGAVVCERNLKEFILPNEDDMVALGWVKFARSIRWLGRVTRGMEPIQKLSAKVATGF